MLISQDSLRLIQSRMKLRCFTHTWSAHYCSSPVAQKGWFYNKQKHKTQYCKENWKEIVKMIALTLKTEYPADNSHHIYFVPTNELPKFRIFNQNKLLLNQSGGVGEEGKTNFQEKQALISPLTWSASIAERALWCDWYWIRAWKPTNLQTNGAVFNTFVKDLFLSWVLA